MQTNTILVSVSDDRSGRKESQYGVTQEKMHKIFVNNPEFGVNKFLMLTWQDITRTQWYHDNKTLLDNTDPARNGRAYKPFTVLTGLGLINEGEYLIYSDCSPEIWRMSEDYKIPENYSLEVLQNLTIANNDILVAFVRWDSRRLQDGDLGSHTHENFTTDLCMNTMKLKQYSRSFMPASGLIVIRKTPKTVDLVKEWLYWCQIDKCSCLGKSDVPGDYSYWDGHEADTKLGARSDQSILGLLLCRDEYQFVNPAAYSAEIPNHNPLLYSNKEETYTFMDPNYNPQTERRIKKGDKVKNAKGVELTVWEIRYEHGIEHFIVGEHRESCYRTLVENLTLVE